MDMSLLSQSPLRGAENPHNRDSITGQIVSDNGMILPHNRTFQGILNTFSRVYSYRWDEAIRHSQENAKAMRRDAYLRSLEQERIAPLTRWKWELEADPDAVNPKDPHSEERETVRRQLEAICRKTYELHQLKWYTGTALWFGRYGAQLRWDDCNLGGFRRKYVGYAVPVHGDKIQMDFDGTPGIQIYPADANKYRDVRPFDGGSKLLMLSSDDLRQRFIIHKHLVEDADFHSPEMAGRVNGVGLRDFVYWAWWLRDEMISWLVDFMEKVGNLGILLFYYDESQPNAKANAEKAAKEASGKNALAVPRPRGGDRQTAGVEMIPANLTGAQFLKDIVADYFERHIERLFVGQSMSGGDGKGDALGGEGKADFARDTKFNLLSWDAENHAGTMSRDLVAVAKLLNFREAPWEYRWVYRLPDPAAKDKLDAITKAASLPGKKLTFKADEVRNLTGMTKPDEGDEICGGDDPQPNGPTPGMPGAPNAANPQNPADSSTPGAENRPLRWQST